MASNGLTTSSSPKAAPKDTHILPSITFLIKGPGIIPAYPWVRGFSPLLVNGIIQTETTSSRGNQGTPFDTAKPASHSTWLFTLFLSGPARCAVFSYPGL